MSQTSKKLSTAEAAAARDALIMRWKAADADLKAAKETELKLRNEVYASCFPMPEVGVNTLELGEGYKLKATRKLNYKLDKDAEKVEAMLDRLDKQGNEGGFIADRLVKWVAEMSVSEYNKLDDKYRKIVDSVLTISDGTPSLELVEPKAKG